MKKITLLLLITVLNISAQAQVVTLSKKAFNKIVKFSTNEGVDKATKKASIELSENFSKITISKKSFEVLPSGIMRKEFASNMNSMTQNKFLKEIGFSSKEVNLIAKNIGRDKVSNIYTWITPKMSSSVIKNLFYDCQDPKFYSFLAKDSRNRISYGKIGEMGSIFRKDKYVLEQVSNGFSPIKLNGYNSKFNGKTISGISYSEKIVKLSNGIKIKAVLPKVNTISKIELPQYMYSKPSVVQKNFAFIKFKEQLRINPKLQSKFTETEIKEILARELTTTKSNTFKVKGYTWRHSEELGVMQLIDNKTYSKIKGISGKSIWRGGLFIDVNSFKSALLSSKSSKGLVRTVEKLNYEDVDLLSDVYNKLPTSVKKKFLNDINSQPRLLTDILKQPEYAHAYKKACLNNFPQEYRSQKYIVQQIMDNKKIIKLVTTDHKSDGKIINGIKYLKKQSYQGGLLVEGVYPKLDGVLKFKSSTKSLSKIIDTKEQKVESLKQLKKALADPNSVTSSKFTKLQRENILSSKVDDGTVKGMGWIKDADGELVLLTNKRLGSILNGSINSIEDVIISKGLISKVKKSGIVEIFNKNGEKLGEYNPISKTIIPTFVSKSSKASGMNQLLTGSNFLPNTSYKVNGATYLTDAQGRVVSMMRPHFARAQKVARNGGEQVGSVTQRGLTSSTHDGGHIVGNQLGGISEGLNYVPQKIELNRGIIKVFEDNIAKNINKAKDFKVKHIYTGTSRTPSSIEYSVTIGGERITKIVNNNL